jgi:CRP-like cAMP-binding protein
MSCIRQFESFGELSVLFKQPMTYTVLTSSAVELAIIEPTSLAGQFIVTLTLCVANILSYV